MRKGARLPRNSRVSCLFYVYVVFGLVRVHPIQVHAWTTSYPVTVDAPILDKITTCACRSRPKIVSRTPNNSERAYFLMPYVLVGFRFTDDVFALPKYDNPCPYTLPWRSRWHRHVSLSELRKIVFRTIVHLKHPLHFDSCGIWT